jgi:hypothetical protein
MPVDDPARHAAASLSAQAAAWARIVAQTEAGYAFSLDDWLNDMDLRRRIEDELQALPQSEQKRNAAAREGITECDKRFRRATVAAGVCVWGSKVAAREGWRADRQWWYFRRPRRSNSALDRDISNVR